MKILSHILILICLLLPIRAMGQHYIGKSKPEVKQMMKENNKEVYEDNTSRNTLFNMVKYVDRLGTQTLIYFFNQGDTCLYSKWMCDYSMLNKVIADLNSSHKQSAEDSWYYSVDGREYKITLATGEWFFTITTRPKKEE